MADKPGMGSIPAMPPGLANIPGINPQTRIEMPPELANLSMRQGQIPAMPGGVANIPGMESQQQVNSAANNVIQLAARMRSPETQQLALQQAMSLPGQLRDQRQQEFDNYIKQQQLAVSQGTLANAQATQQANEKRYQASNLSALAKQGLKIDDTGQIVAQDDSELSPLLKQQIADKKSLEEFRTADAEYKRAAAELDKDGRAHV